MKYKNLKILLIILVYLLTFSILNGGNESKRGSAGAQELLIPVAARGLALGNSLTADARGIEALYWNPAGLAATQASTEFLISHMQYIADIQLEYAAFAKHFGVYGSVALSATVLNIGEIPETTIEYPDGTGNIFSPSFQVYTLSYSRSFTDRISLGANVKLVYEHILQEQAAGISIDFGAQYDTGIEGLRFGIVVRNLGPSFRFEGPDLSRGRTEGSSIEPISVMLADIELPVSISAGMVYEFSMLEKDRWKTFFEFQDNDADLEEMKCGIEYNYDDMVFLRSGYQTDTKFSRTTTAKERYLFGPSFGFGIKFTAYEEINLKFDYAFRQTKYFDGNHMITLSVLW